MSCGNAEVWLEADRGCAEGGDFRLRRREERRSRARPRDARETAALPAVSRRIRLWQDAKAAAGEEIPKTRIVSERIPLTIPG